MTVLTRRQGWSVACFFGVLLALTQPPISLTPLMWIAFPGFFLLQKDKSVFEKTLLGGFFGLGFFVAGLYWIAVALHVDFAKFWWLTPFAVLGLPALLSVLFVSGALLAYEGARRLLRADQESYVLFALMWGLFEYLRGHVLTGFPWNLVGYTWVWSSQILQLTSILGIYGLSFLTVLLAGLPLMLCHKHRIWALGTSAVIVSLAWGWGHHRLGYENIFVPNVALRLVQPCVPQTLKWERDQRRAIFEDMASLSRLPSGKQITHVLWPESALPFFAQDNPRVLQMLGALVPAPQGALILGVPRQSEEAGTRTLWNGLMAVSAKGEVLATYDKHHLVPFGEYIPGRVLIPGTVKKITAGGLDYSPGVGPRTLRLQGDLPPFSPLICYEVIFPGHIVARQDPPQWLLNLTNDGWYGRTSGPYQHFAMSRVRAVEEGLPLVRVANNGISAVVDPMGRVLARLKLDEKGVLDADLPRALPSTLYARFGDAFFWALLFVGFVCVCRNKKRIIT